MPILQHWRGVWDRAKEFTVTNDFSPDMAPVVNQCANDAYKFCALLFGTPLDPQKPYKILQGERSFHCFSSGVHMIVISRHAKTDEELSVNIAHEMYHRVTANRKGLVGNVWTQELMAALTSLWFLEYQGYKAYVESAKNQWLTGKGKADVSILRNASNGVRQHILSGAAVYSEAFVESLWRITYALKGAVKIKDLSSLVNAGTLEEWVTSLPPERQYTVRRIMELPTGEDTPKDSTELDRLFYALQAKDGKHAVAAEFEQIAESQPANGAVFFYLGLAYQKAEQPENALRAYNQARDLGFADKWLNYNIGTVCWRIKNYELAAEWFGRAAEQSLDWAQPRYFLGRSLNNLGNVPAARQAWEEVLTLSDEHYAKLAEKALQENPLPDAPASE